jgi:uncharacterized protein (UPF0332 family)
VKAADLIRKAHRALESSHLLITADDLDGACNRAYYAMFDAARAALHVADIPALSSGMPRPHNGVISAFSQYLVKPGKISVDFGRALNRVEDVHLIADYHGTSIDRKHAEQAVVEAHDFVQAIILTFPGFDMKLGTSFDKGH